MLWSRDSFPETNKSTLATSGVYNINNDFLLFHLIVHPRKEKKNLLLTTFSHSYDFLQLSTQKETRQSVSCLP